VRKRKKERKKGRKDIFTKEKEHEKGEEARSRGDMRA